MNEEKEVYFDQYCKTCKYHGLSCGHQEDVRLHY